MQNKKTAEFWLNRSHRQLKRCRRLAEHNDKLKLYAEICACLNSSLSALILEIRNLDTGGPGGDPTGGQGQGNEN
jgi:hypothetical protein